MVREHKRSKALTVTIIIILVLVFLVGLILLAGGGKVGPTPKTMSDDTVLFQRRSTQFSRTDRDEVDPQLFTYTSYRLGLRFQYRNLYQTRVRQAACPDNWPSCPMITSTVNVKSPVEKGNAIDFADYHLEVFDKDEGETFPNALKRVIFKDAPDGSCMVNYYPQTEDKVEKATINYAPFPGMIDDDTCPSHYRGGHFFMYPKYPFEFFYVQGPEGTPPLFSHKGTWIETIQIAPPIKK